jgi:hypothetical protein
MGQLHQVYKLPEDLYFKTIEMLNRPGLSLAKIVDTINAQAGKEVLKETSLRSFLKNMESYTGIKRGTPWPTSEVSLARLATAFERIADSLEKLVEKQG